MDDLVTWLRAQLDEDERIAREAVRYADATWRLDSVDNVAVSSVLTAAGEQEAPITADRWRRPMVESAGVVAHVAAHDPARVLREVDAKRQWLEALIGESHATLRPGGSTEIYCGADYGTSESCECGRDDRVSQYLRLLALPYADRPGYREEWRP